MFLTEIEQVLALAVRLDRGVRGEHAPDPPGRPSVPLHLLRLDGTAVTSAGKGTKAWLGRLRELGTTRVHVVPDDWPGLDSARFSDACGPLGPWLLVAVPDGIAWAARVAGRPRGWVELPPCALAPLPTIESTEPALTVAIDHLARTCAADREWVSASRVLAEYLAVSSGDEPVPDWAVERARVVRPGEADDPATTALARALDSLTILGGGALAELLLPGPATKLQAAAVDLRSAIHRALVAAAGA